MPLGAQSGSDQGKLALLVPASLLLTFLGLPLLLLLTGTHVEDVRRAVSSPLALPALGLSLVTTTITTLACIVLGTPLAWLLARSRTRLARLLETLVELPIVVPPAVAGVALLLAFGRQSPLSGWLFPEGASLSLTTTAVVIAQIFVAAPLYVLSAKSAFSALDDELFLLAQTFGARALTVFFRIGIPLAKSGLTSGALLAFARALGEFGATLMFAGNMEGRTQTLPLAIYTALESDLGTARVLSGILILLALLLLMVVRAGRGPVASSAWGGA